MEAIKLLCFFLAFELASAKSAQWGSWSKYTPCTKSCGTGTRTRTRTCIPIEGDLLQKLGRSKQNCMEGTVEQMERPCNRKPCPDKMKLFWGEWGPWGPCPVTCGDGVQSRSRTCLSEKWIEGLDDEIDPEDEPECVLGDRGVEKRTCTIQCPPVDGGWGDWSKDSSVCAAVDCRFKNLTLTYKTRLCDNPTPQYGGRMCQGPAISIFTCTDPMNCPVDGGWGPYEVVSCENGVVTRVRECNNPAPRNGGRNCPSYNSAKVDTFTRNQNPGEYQQSCPDDLSHLINPRRQPVDEGSGVDEDESKEANEEEEDENEEEEDENKEDE